MTLALLLAVIALALLTWPLPGGGLRSNALTPNYDLVLGPDPVLVACGGIVGGDEPDCPRGAVFIDDVVRERRIYAGVAAGLAVAFAAAGLALRSRDEDHVG